MIEITTLEELREAVHNPDPRIALTARLGVYLHLHEFTEHDMWLINRLSGWTFDLANPIDPAQCVRYSDQKLAPDDLRAASYIGYVDLCEIKARFVTLRGLDPETQTEFKTALREVLDGIHA